MDPLVILSKATTKVHCPLGWYKLSVTFRVGDWFFPFIPLPILVSGVHCRREAGPHQRVNLKIRACYIS